ncbi:MAG: hypothetical protein ACTHQ3_06830, partial [Motilibacteraceae bacterium]
MLRDLLPPRPSSPLGLLPARRREAEDFAALLEDGPHGTAARSAGPELRELGALATALVPTQVSPTPEFRAALRGRLLAEPVLMSDPAGARRARVADVRQRPVRRGRRRVV